MESNPVEQWSESRNSQGNEMVNTENGAEKTLQFFY